MSTRASFYRDTCFLARVDPDAIAHLKHNARKALVALRQIHCAQEFLALFPPDAIALMFVVDRQGTILAANRTMAERVGVSYSSIIGHQLFQGRDPDITHWRRTALAEVFRTGKTTRVVDRGEGLSHNASLFPVLDDEGRVQMVIVIACQMEQVESTFLKDDNRPAVRLIE